MLKKVISIIVLLHISGYHNTISAAEDSSELTIIPRVSWGANSQYNDVNSDYWTAILESRANYIAPYRSPETIAAATEKTNKINSYLNENFSDQFTYQEKVSYNTVTNTEYAWDLKYTEYVDAIIVHHTHSEYADDLTGMQDIHRYHAINRQWGDIGYNYIIGYDGDIYEGREGGDYVVGAHSTYNNNRTVGIAVLGDYDLNGVNENQYHALETLIKELTVKYSIDLSKNRYYHMNCSGINCDTFPLETYLDRTLVGHRDATHTTCPGEKLYEQIQQIREDNLEFTAGFELIARGSESKNVKGSTDENTYQIQKLLIALNKYTKQEQEAIYDLINTKLEQDIDTDLKEKLQTLRLAIILSLEK